METLSRPIRLIPSMALVLDRITRTAEPYPVYQQPAAVADDKVIDVARSLLTDANLTHLVVMQYLWFVREVARLLRTRTGRDLAFHIEAVMRKWQSFGCEPSSMQEIVVQIHNTFRPAEAVEPESSTANRSTAMTPRSPGWS